MGENNNKQQTEMSVEFAFHELITRLDRIADALECLCNADNKLVEAVDDDGTLAVINYPADRWTGCNYEKCPRAFWTPPEPGTSPVEKWKKGELPWQKREETDNADHTC